MLVERVASWCLERLRWECRVGCRGWESLLRTPHGEERASIDPAFQWQKTELSFRWMNETLINDIVRRYGVPNPKPWL